jgi:hypothetical protein
MASKAKTTEQEHFFRNVERAQHAGVTTKTSQSVRLALFAGLSYCNFGHCVVDLTDEYLVDCQDRLAEAAMDQGKYDSIKWASFPG